MVAEATAEAATTAVGTNKQKKTHTKQNKYDENIRFTCCAVLKILY